MKIHELLTEKISLTSQIVPLRNKVIGILNQTMIDTASYYSLPSELKELQIDLHDIVEQKLFKYLSNYSKSITKSDVKIKFEKFDSAVGGNYSYPMNILFLNKLLIFDIVKHFVIWFRASTNSKSSVSTEQFFRQNFEQSISKFCGIVIHELTHVIQKHKAGSDDYVSSLIEPKRDKIHIANMVLHNSEFRQEYEKIIGRKITADELQHFKNIYLSQPQEIVAYAHQIANDLIKHYSKTQSITKRIQQIDKEFENIKNNKVQHPYSHMINSTDKLLKKTYQRFISELYQQLRMYIDSIE